MTDICLHNHYNIWYWVRTTVNNKNKPLWGFFLLLVGEVGIEPTWYRYHWILSPARLPIPPFARGVIIS